MSDKAKATQDLVRAAIQFAIAAAEQGVTVEGASDPAAALYAYAKATGAEPDSDLPGKIAAMVGSVPDGGKVVSREWVEAASAAYQRCKSFPEESLSGVMALITLRNLFEKVVDLKPITRGTGGAA